MDAYQLKYKIYSYFNCAIWQLMNRAQVTFLSVILLYYFVCLVNVYECLDMNQIQLNVNCRNTQTMDG